MSEERREIAAPMETEPQRMSATAPVLTPRERIRRLLRREPTDRIPNGLGGCETAGLHNLAYDTLKRILGVSDCRNRVCTFMNNAIFEPSVLEAMQGDTILLGTKMCPSRFWGPQADREWKDLHIWGTTLQVANDWSFRQDPDGSWWWDEESRCVPGSLYFDVPPAEDSLESFGTGEIPPPDEFKPSHELSEERLRKLEEDARFLYETTNYSIVCGEFVHDLQLRPGGTARWWMAMVEEPDICHEYLGKACDAAIGHLKQIDQAVGKYCDFMMIADDIGGQRGVTIGPDLWRRIYKPHYKRLFTEWRRTTNMKVCLHCCGSTVDVLDDLIECGVDIYNPVQISAERMDPVALQRRFGDRVIFYGGVLDVPLCLPWLSESEVYEQVKRNIENLSRGGGYLFAGVHNLPGDLPEGHLRAFLQAWRDTRDRPDLTGSSPLEPAIT